jgi:signal transduction histidine kinase
MSAARLRRVAGWTALPAVLPWAGGCTDAPTDTGAWLFVSLALLTVAAATYALGALRGRQRSDAELRAARLALRCAAQLRTGWSWETDPAGRLLAWQAPGLASTAACPLFAGAHADPRLAGSLQAEQAFAGLHVRAVPPLEGSHGWELRGVPRHDDLGRFSGFVGSARPTDDDDAQRTAAAALAPVLAAGNTPAVVAMNAGDGWRVQQFSPAARTLWPGLETGALLDTSLAGVPAAVRAAWSGAPAGAAPDALAADAAGWQVSLFGPLPGGTRGLVLARPAVPTTAAETLESETFSFTVSHDLRAPIRVVDGFTRIVKEDYGRLLDRVGNDHLDRVLGAAARMNLMIDALLTLARLSSQPLARQPVNLSQLAGYVVDDLRRSAPEREAEIEIEPDLTALGDPTLLRLVLENLLGNAWKYSVRCSRAQISLRVVAQGGRCAFVVRDNGAGFDMRSADRLFGLFQRLHSSSDFPGHGVGLASVRRIVHRHGGEIWAEAETGRGAAFYFTLAV